MSGIARIPQETVDQIHELHKQGLGTRKIAEELGICRSTVRRKLDPACAEHIRRHQREYRLIPGVRDKLNQSQRRRQRKQAQAIKYRVLSHYSNGGIPECACCGENEVTFLTINHVDGGGTKHRKGLGGHHFYEWLERHNYPPGYNTLCRNCNWAFHVLGYCPHHSPNRRVIEVRTSMMVPMLKEGFE